MRERGNERQAKSIPSVPHSSTHSHTPTLPHSLISPTTHSHTPTLPHFTHDPLPHSRIQSFPHFTDDVSLSS